MSNAIIAARHDFPVIELAPRSVRCDQTVEAMVAGLANTNPDITSAHFPECRSGRQEQAHLFLAKPLSDRQHLPTDDVLRLLTEAGFVPEDLPSLALLKEYADELWEAGVYYVAALGAKSIWLQADGNYAVYLLTNPEDRGFHLHWLGADTAGGTKAIKDDYRADLNGQLWFVVRRG